jgi:hypothetical protein
MKKDQLSFLYAASDKQIKEIGVHDRRRTVNGCFRRHERVRLCPALLRTDKSDTRPERVSVKARGC